MTEPREKSLNDLLSHHMVDIYVGPENTHWILHEKLLCAKSKFFNQIFYTRYGKGKDGKNLHGGNKTFGLPDEEDEPFRLFVGWLYSGRIVPPDEEKDLGDLFDLYLMGEKWQIAALVKDVLDAVRKYYRVSDTFPGLRRVQYIYASTDDDSPMRQLMVSSVARMLVLGQTMPGHWERALRKNGQLSFDIIRAIQQWKLDPESMPDARQEAQALEEEKVKAVEKAEEQQQGTSKGEQHNTPKGEQQGNLKGEQQSHGLDDAASAGKDVEKLANGLPNGHA